jgi:hypothetical protein
MRHATLGIMQFFIRAKAWMLFVAFIAPMLFSNAIIIVGSLSGGGMDSSLRAFAVGWVLWVAVFVSWLWSLGTFLHQLVETETRMRVHVFKIGLGYAAMYMIVLSALMFQGLHELEVFRWLMPPFHMLAMACMFYSIYFVAKNLAMAEKKRVSFPDYAGYFMFLWFFPLGVWAIQPRINKLIS